MTMPTLLDIAKANGSDAVAGLIDETVKVVPEVSLGHARTIKGLNYKTLVRTALPSGSFFRGANEGVDEGKSILENRLVEAYPFNPRWACDRAVADAHEDGAAAFIAQEALAIVTASMQHLGKQFFYGNATGGNGNTKGHPGLIGAYDSTSMVIDAGGTTDNVASSLWAVRFGLQDVTWVWGQNGQLKLEDVRLQDKLDANSKPYTAYVQEIMSFVGLQVGRTFSCARIKKLTTDSGKGLTDARIGSLLALFPVGYPPTHMFCSRRSLEQLRASRTATNATGQEAPMPTEVFGIPILPTDSILNTETLAS